MLFRSFYALVKISSIFRIYFKFPSFLLSLSSKCSSKIIISKFLSILQVVSTSTNLSIIVNKDTIGRYFCKASVPGYADIVEQAIVHLKGPPRITSARRQFGFAGESVSLECTAFSIPKARFVSWSFNGHDINNTSSEFRIKEEILPYGIKSTLVIERSALKHFSHYNCSVINDYGSDILEIELNGGNKCKLLLQMISHSEL